MEDKIKSSEIFDLDPVEEVNRVELHLKTIPADSEVAKIYRAYVAGLKAGLKCLTT